MGGAPRDLEIRVLQQVGAQLLRGGGGRPYLRLVVGDVLHQRLAGELLGAVGDVLGRVGGRRGDHGGPGGRGRVHQGVLGVGVLPLLRHVGHCGEREREGHFQEGTVFGCPPPPCPGPLPLLPS